LAELIFILVAYAIDYTTNSAFINGAAVIAIVYLFFLVIQVGIN